MTSKLCVLLFLYLSHSTIKVASFEYVIIAVITHWENLLDLDWLRNCEFKRNVRANSVIRGKLQISITKSVIHSECKCEKELTMNN